MNAGKTLSANPPGLGDSLLCLDVDSRVWDSGLGFMDLDSWVLIPGFGFMGFGSPALGSNGAKTLSTNPPGIGDSLLCRDVDSWVWISGLRFMGLDSCVWIPRFRFMAYDS